MHKTISSQDIYGAIGMDVDVLVALNQEVYSRLQEYILQVDESNLLVPMALPVAGVHDRAVTAGTLKVVVSGEFEVTKTAIAIVDAYREFLGASNRFTICPYILALPRRIDALDENGALVSEFCTRFGYVTFS
jgi:hypothetical protein